MDFFDLDFSIKEITFACKVLAGCGENIHINRPSHGLAFNVGGEKQYCFSDEKNLTVKANDVIFLPQYSNYTVKNISDGDCYAINFTLFNSGDFKPFVFHPKNPSYLSDIFAKAEKAFKAMKTGYTLELKAMLYSILYTMIREHNAPYASSDKKELLSPAIDYIHNFYAESDMNMNFLSELCGIKPSYFRQLFNLCYNEPPIKYINNLKLARAETLLKETSYSTQAICEMSGFSNLYYFYRYFKKTTGKTPSEYRKSSKRT